MMLRITNDKDNENYTKHFKNYSECKEWMYNHLDISKKWSVRRRRKRSLSIIP